MNDENVAFILDELHFVAEGSHLLMKLLVSSKDLSVSKVLSALIETLDEYLLNHSSLPLDWIEKITHLNEKAEKSIENLCEFALVQKNSISKKRWVHAALREKVPSARYPNTRASVNRQLDRLRKKSNTMLKNTHMKGNEAKIGLLEFEKHKGDEIECFDGFDKQSSFNSETFDEQALQLEILNRKIVHEDDSVVLFPADIQSLHHYVNLFGSHLEEKRRMYAHLFNNLTSPTQHMPPTVSSQPFLQRPPLISDLPQQPLDNFRSSQIQQQSELSQSQRKPQANLYSYPYNNVLFFQNEMSPNSLLSSQSPSQIQMEPLHLDT
eukprot:TRINITY_DN2299_c0_g1_i1.p1 TRINITY_DN2299_c0_g1~~TRINITY_DN2299_c0_g1_i1.p1  ORF type:complete len:323 (+),score=106.17 TRINITY_DN2299_c0_g1_i1:36-1004(+)